MTRARTSRLALVAAIACSAGWSGAAFAQDGLPRDRTGAQAAPLPQPDYAAPPPASPSAAPGDGQAAPYVPPAPAPQVIFADVHVTPEGEGVAHPAPGWTPAADPVTGLKLEAAGAAGFDAEWVRRQFAANGLLGVPADYSRLVALVQLVNRAFLQNGYANSGVLLAPQAYGAGTGVLELRLVAGRIGGADGDGFALAWRDGKARGLDAGYVTDRMPSVRATPFNAFALERDFRLLADNPAIRAIDATLKPGTRPGEAAVSVIVAPERRFDLYTTLANNRSPAVGGIRAALGGAMRNVIASGDLLGFEAGITDGLKDGSVAYTGPVIDTRTAITLRGGLNDAAVVERLLDPLDIRSKEWSVEGGLSRRLVDRPLMPRGASWSSAKSLDLGFLVVHRQTRSMLLGAPFSFSPGAVDGRAEYTALRLTSDYVERGVRHVLALSFTETVGLEGTRSRLPGALNPNRHFVAFLGQASFARRLSHNLELNLRLAGQYARGTLYSGERFSIGGERGVRGYRENLLLVDRGLLGSAELAYSFSLTGSKGTGPREFDWGAFRAAIFADGALAENARSPQPFPKSLAGVGASLTWKPSEALSARVTWAEALRDPRLTGSRHLQDRGFQFRVTLRPLLF